MTKKALIPFLSGLFLLALAAVALAAAPVSVSPPNAKTDAGSNANAAVVYNEAIDPASVNAASFPVYSFQRGRLNGSYAVNGGVVSFDPALSLMAGEKIMAVASSGVRNITGTAASAYAWQFTAITSPGPGDFSNSSAIGPAMQTQDIALGDVNGDGFLDTVVGTLNNQNVVYLNNGSGQMTGGQVNFGTGNDLTLAIALSDINRDGALDIVTGNSGEQSYVFLNVGGAFPGSSGSPEWRPFGSPSDNIVDLAVGDLNNDGWPDIVAAIPDGYSKVFLSSLGSFPSSINIGSPAWGTKSVDVGDFDNDGKLDIVLGNSAVRSVLLKNDGSGSSFTSVAFGVSGDDTRAIKFLDANRDGWLDVALGNYATQNRVYLNNKAGSFTLTPLGFGTGSDHTEDIAAADFNGDGYMDLAVANRAQQSRIYYYDPAIQGYTNDTNFGPNNTAANSVDAGDLDRDGDMDVVQGNDNQPGYSYLNGGFDHFPPTVNKSGQVDAPFVSSSVVTWTVTARQNGPTAALYMTDVLTNYTYLSHAAAPALTVISTAPFRGYWASVDTGQTVTLTLVTRLAGSPPTTPTNTASFTATNYLTSTSTLPATPYCNGQPCAYYPGGLAPTVSKSGQVAAPFTPGSVVTWTVAATQNGLAAALYVTDVLTDYTYLSHTAAPALTVLSTSPFRGYWASVDTGQTVTLTLVTRVAGAPSTTPTNTASFTATNYLTPTSTLPVTPYCNSQPCPYFSSGLPPTVSKSGQVDAPFTPGSVVTWTVTSRQNDAAAALYVTDVLTNYTYLSHASTPALTVLSTSPFWGYWAGLDTGEMVTLTLVTRVAGAPAITPTNTASLTTTNTLTPTLTLPVTPYCNGQPCAYYRPGVAPTVAKSGASTRPYVGGSVVTWTVVVTNNGAADDFYITDPLEPNFVYLTHTAAPPLEEIFTTGPAFQAKWSGLPPAQTATLTLVTRLLSAAGLTPTNTAFVTSTAYLTPTQAGPAAPRCGAVSCPFVNANVELAPPAQSLAGLPGQAVGYALTLTNAGTLTDSFTLGQTSPWAVVLAPTATAGPLTGYSATPLTLTVTIPAGAISGTVVGSRVTAASQINPAATAAAVATTTVGFAPGSGLVIAPVFVTPPPLTATRPISWAQLITNTANTTDTAWVTITPPAGWPAQAISPIIIGPGQTAAVTIILTAPITATLTPTHTAVITVSGSLDATPMQAQDVIYIFPDPNGDADGDGVLNRYEDRNGDGNYANDDTDGDGIPDYLDVDDDGDGVWTKYEYPDRNHDGNPSDALNTDGDALPDYLDPNDDNDTRLTIDEVPDPNHDGNPNDAIDADSDGIPNYLDADDGVPLDGDADGDGIPDSVECSSTPCRDSDADGLPDYLDTDSDNDGLLDRYEYDKNGDGVADDTDGDGVPDYRDPDDDGDGKLTKNEQADPNGDGNPADAVDTDGDGIPDYLDRGSGAGGGDSDNDTIPDSRECPSFPCVDTDKDGVPDYMDIDADGDGVDDRYEYDRNNDGVADDTDRDGAPDFRDPDDDGDGKLTKDEQADPNGDGNPSDAVDSNHNGVPDYLDPGAAPDADGDGIPDSVECPSMPCRDSDGDGTPDFQDTDSDNDGVLDKYECPGGSCLDTDHDGLPNYIDFDDDGDGLLTVLEHPDPNGDGNPSDALDSDHDGTPDYLDAVDGPNPGSDIDGDGIPDSVECSSTPCRDSDSDGIPDYLDTDSDNDGVLDKYEYDKNGDGVADDTNGNGLPDYRDPDDDGDGQLTKDEQADPNGDGNPSDAVDTDGDGIPDYLDPTNSNPQGDGDGDGIPDSVECPSFPCRDSDADGIPDYMDTDSDNDGILDKYECPALFCRDTDGDGLPDYRDPDDDGDGQLTKDEQADPNGDGNPSDAVNSDSDAIPDYLDKDDHSASPGGGDSDGDGATDAAECPAGPPCADTDGDTVPDYMDTTPNFAPGLYLSVYDGTRFVAQGVITGPLTYTTNVPVPARTGDSLTYTIAITNTGALTTTAALTAVYSTGYNPANTETWSLDLQPGAGGGMLHPRLVAATGPATLTLVLDVFTIYGRQRLTINRPVSGGGIYLPIIFKR